MKVGIIGIGNICKKAYLPMISLGEDLEIVLCTRNDATIKEVSKKYRINESVNNIDDLINKNIEAAFVHSSTESHYEICKKLIENKINVYVDKPISYNYSEAEELYKLAKKNNVILMVGFNRRFVPKVKELKALGAPDIIIMEKNRVNLPGDIRTFIFDDFIHVLDTVRFLMNEDFEDFSVNYKIKENKLINVVIKLVNKNTTAIAIMNRDNGITEETIEYMASGKKSVVTSLVKATNYEENTISISEFGDWENTLYKRGFKNIIDEFIESIKSVRPTNPTIEDSLKTHKLCEDIVAFIERDSK